MSSFNNPHHFYLFAMKNGKRKLGYGASPEDAYETLRLRLTDREIEAIEPAQFIRITQRQLREHIKELG